ncbi:MAG: hypothetical protein CVV36_06295, partial [Candidatus Methanoperedenaceae archaeon HGW-Methanoperedenaceae-1]
MGWWVDPTKNGAGYVYAGVDLAPFEVYVYAMVLSETGTIMKGKEGQLTGYVSDYKRLAPGGGTGHHIEYFGETVFGNKTLTFVDDGSIAGDTSGDGIYTAKVTLDKTKGASLVADHMVMNVSVSYPGYASSTPQQILISGWYCMNGVQSGKGHGTHVDTTTGKSANCAVCHRGYEHWFENVSGTFTNDQLDIHALKANAPDILAAQQPTQLFDSNRWNYSDDAAPAGTYMTFEQQVTGSKYCAFCHEVDGSATYDYGAGDRSNYADRPMCNTSGCHTITPISGTTVPAWSPPSVVGSATTRIRAMYNISKAQQHAHDDQGANTVACATCHRPQHSLELPNRTSTDYTDLSTRCLSCHTTFNKHNNSVSCIKCHTNDVHNIRFLQQDVSYNWSRSNIVTCDNCHTNLTFAGALSLSPPQVPYTNHSGDADAGQKWGDFWTSDNQQAAVGGSNLILSSTVVVSSSSSVIGSAGAISGAQTVDGTYQTLTEGWANVIDKYAYVDSNSNVWGTVSNLANAQNASDSNAYATFTEQATGSGTNVAYFGSLADNAPTVTDPGNAESIDGANALMGSTGSAYVTLGSFSGLNMGGTITSVTMNVRFKGVSGGGAEKLTISHNKGAITQQHSENTGVLTNFSTSITVDRTWTWEDLQGLTITATRDSTGIEVDAVWLQVSYSDIKIMDITTPISTTTASDLYYIELNYYTSGDTFDIFAYNGTGWVDKGDLTQTGSFTVFNTSLTPAEYNSGSPIIKFMGKTASGTTGYLYVEYERVHSFTGGSSAASNHYESRVNHNFTGIPKYAASEVAEYTVKIKGYGPNENLHIYAYDYGSNTYQLVKDSALPTSNGWSNHSLPYTAISDSGNASIQFRDSNTSRDDDTATNFYLDYVAIKADTNKFLPCFYCHALLANHKKRALGNIEWIQGGYDTPNPMNSTDLANTYWCANCHYNGSTPSGRFKYNGTAWSPTPPRIDVNNVANNSGSWFDHSGTVASNFTDAKCKTCHGTAAILTTKDAPHSVEVGTGGGNNCLQCHNLVTGLSGGAPKGINFTAANLSVHYGMNSLNATNAGFAPVIGACWACHDTDGNVSSGHPDKYKTPKTCTDCHLVSGTYNSQTTGWGGLTVSEHYYSGSDIKAGNSSSDIASCINCHENVSEMIIYNNDTDTGSFTGDSVRLTGGNMSFYHYGKNKSWTQDTNAYCYNCHNNASTAFPFADNANKTIANHSSAYPASNPACGDCHSTGRIHNSTLYKPVLTLPNSSYCLTCHGTGGSATIKNLERHNGSTGLNCTNCHLNSTKSIHPVRYLQQDGTTWNTIKTNAVNCTTCHQNSGLSGVFASAPKVPAPINHSTNTYSGALWNSTPGYWTNSSQQNSCNYCHTSSALHNTSGLGKIPMAENSKNQGFAGSYWCANCHYSSAANYFGNTYTPQPP